MAYVFYLDRYHLGDPLFVPRLARALGGLRAPRVLVHGPGEDAERALEADGRVPRWEDGLLVTDDPADQADVEAAARGLNRRIAEALNEAGVAAVRLDGASRGLVRADPAQGLVWGGAAWLRALLLQGGVPVVMAFAAVPGGLGQVAPGVFAGALARHLGARVVLFGRGLRQGVTEAGVVRPAVRRAEVGPEVLPEPEAAGDAVGEGAEVLLTGPAGIGTERVEGTLLTEEGPAIASKPPRKA